jgi:hypothetical protein
MPEERKKTPRELAIEIEYERRIAAWPKVLPAQMSLPVGPAKPEPEEPAEPGDAQGLLPGMGSHVARPKKRRR